jgi:cobalt-zinc-cadmium efflux system outer membrane protein
VGLPPNPSLAYLGSEVGNAGTAGQQGAMVGQDVIRGNKLGLNRALVCRQIVEAQQVLAALEQRVLTDVRLAYYDLLVARRRSDLASELLTISESAVDASARLLAAKEIPRIGLLQTEVQQQQARILVQRAEAEQLAAWRRLAALIGSTDLPPQPVTGDLQQLPAELEWDQELSRILSQSPEVAAAGAAVEVARAALQRSYAETVPDANVQLSLQYDHPSATTIAGVQAGLPLMLWNRNQGGIRRAQADVVAAERNLDRLELDLRQRLATAFREYSAAHYQAATISQVILPKASETFELVSRGFQQGQVGYLDLLSAQRTLFETNLSLVDALRALWQSRVRIEGLLLDESLRRASV